MHYIYPEFLAAGLTNGPPPQQMIPWAQRDDVPAFVCQGKTKSAVLTWSLPLRYFGLPLRRRLIRLMLTLLKCGEAASDRVREPFTAAADYARSVIDTAMLRGELRCRPSGEMAHDYLIQTRELLILMAGPRQDNAMLRREVRRRTADFLIRYEPGARR